MVIFLYHGGGDINGISCDIICGPSHNILYGLFYFVTSGKEHEFVLWSHDPPILVNDYLDIDDGKIKICGYDDV
jgi:hypothetical protein